MSFFEILEPLKGDFCVKSALLQFAGLCSVVFLTSPVFAAPQFQDDSRSASFENSRNYLHDKTLLAQSDPDEAFDPFSDYSEFDEASDEEADINFFRNGRFFTVALAGGYRGFTDNFSKVYTGGPTYGLSLTYFFDLRLAMTLGFTTGDNAVKIESETRSYVGNVSFTTLNFDLKYYMNTQNVTRGLADLNPYLIGGFGQFYRTYTLAGLDGYSRDSTMGMELGAGLEVPLMRKKAYLGIQGMYHYVNFADENKGYINETPTSGSVPLKTTVTGDLYDVMLLLGLNF
jgi:hypothetical protein